MSEDDPSKQQQTGSPRRPAGEAPPQQQAHQFTAVNQNSAGVNGSTRSPSNSTSPSETSPAQSRNAQPPSSFQAPQAHPPPPQAQQSRPIPPMMASMGPAESAAPPPPPPPSQNFAPPVPAQAHRPEWRHDASDDSLAHKRKRDEEVDDNGRAISPTTQTARHHLAAHEAAMGPFTGGQQQHPSQTPGEDRYPYDRKSTGDDEGGNITQQQDGSAQPAQPEKKRKRQFANRTKTGCITCRRRKKKCDEGKPECSNCKRGGFVCEGYSGKVSWQKPTGKGGASMSPGVNGSPATMRTHEPQEPSPNVHSRVMPMQHRVMIDDRYPSGSPSESPAPMRLQGTYESQFSATPRGSTAGTTPRHSATPVSTYSVTPAPLPGRPLSMSHTPMSTTMSGGTPAQGMPSEKFKMTRGEWYYPNDPELVRERHECKKACYRYNNTAQNPLQDVSDSEKTRMLLEVLRPGKQWEVISAGNQSIGGGFTMVSPDGHQSDVKNITVEGPFTCTYGYNIQIEPDVTIEAGCSIMDSAQVTIKARTILSEGVKIYTSTHPTDSRKRHGTSGQQQAKPVTIEEDCWVGGNSVIMGGVHIGKGTVITAGSVVTGDMPGNVIVSGNPASIKHVLNHNGPDA